jgi:hypothetical protein
MKHHLGLLLLALCSCQALPPYVYTEVSVGDTDLDLWRGIGEDGRTLVATVGVGWYTAAIPVKLSEAPQARIPLDEQQPPEPEIAPQAAPKPLWWQDKSFLAWLGGALALIFGGGYGARRWAKRRNGTS